jgi:putative tricarboxylic transport membrane protein
VSPLAQRRTDAIMQRNLITGIAALVIGAGYLAMALQLRASALADAVGPAGLPKVLGFLMLGLGLILCIQAALAGRERPSRVAVAAAPHGRAEVDPADDAEGMGLAGLGRAGGLLAIAAAYLLVVRVVGYPVAVAALLIAAAIHGGVKPTWRLVLIAIAGAAAYWVLFVVILGIPLPGGILAGPF